LRQTGTVGRGSNSKSPGGYTGTYNRHGEPLDDPDYSLSVSELNSNVDMANSLLKSATRHGYSGKTGNRELLEGMSPDSSLAPRFQQE